MWCTCGKLKSHLQLRLWKHSTLTQTGHPQKCWNCIFSSGVACRLPLLKVSLNSSNCLTADRQTDRRGKPVSRMDYSYLECSSSSNRLSRALVWPKCSHQVHVHVQKPGFHHGKPESSCELQGATLEWITSGSGSAKKKKNVFQVIAPFVCDSLYYTIDPRLKPVTLTN